MPNIFQWKDISKDFADCLILGNGASMAVDSSFSYKNLFAEAEDTGLITKDVSSIFDHLKTKDFELVLRILWHAYHVNQALGLEEDRTTRAYDSVRKSLIKAVRSIHVD